MGLTARIGNVVRELVAEGAAIRVVAQEFTNRHLAAPQTWSVDTANLSGALSAEAVLARS